MCKKIWYLSFLSICLFSCDTGQVLKLVNPMDFDRIDEPVLIQRADFEKHYSTEDERFLCLKNEKGEIIPYQLDDLDGDGAWDELAFLVSVEAREKITISVEWQSGKNIDFEKRTQVYLGRKIATGEFEEVYEALAPKGLDGFPTKYQSEGVGWENDKMAFRVYFDCRNAKDLFGKREPALILHKAGTPEMGNYHQLKDWGMDVLHCGSSLGAGGLAMYQNDSLYRLGSTERYHYQEIIDGPIRSVFELSYTGWVVEDETLDAKERITLWAGQHGFESEVLVSGFTDEKELAVGIVTSKIDREPEQISLNENFSAILVFGKQSMNNDFLSMAVMIPENELVRAAQSSNENYFLQGYQTVPSKGFSHPISETFFVSQRIQNAMMSKHYFYAFWELENKDWSDPDQVKAHLRMEAERKSNPLKMIF